MPLGRNAIYEPTELTTGRGMRTGRGRTPRVRARLLGSGAGGREQVL